MARDSTIRITTKGKTSNKSRHTSDPDIGLADKSFKGTMVNRLMERGKDEDTILKEIFTKKIKICKIIMEILEFKKNTSNIIKNSTDRLTTGLKTVKNMTGELED